MKSNELTSAQELSIIQEALNVGPEDQSLWYYHQFLMLNLTDFAGRPTITPGFTDEDRISYVMREIEIIRELLDDYEDVKWIYEALVEHTLSLCQLMKRPPESDERIDLKDWLDKLREMDPMRSGRWNDMERDCGLAEVE